MLISIVLMVLLLLVCVRFCSFDSVVEFFFVVSWFMVSVVCICGLVGVSVVVVVK